MYLPPVQLQTPADESCAADASFPLVLIIHGGPQVRPLYLTIDFNTVVTHYQQITILLYLFLFTGGNHEQLESQMELKFPCFEGLRCYCC
jgi:hypothetical protein